MTAHVDRPRSRGLRIRALVLIAVLLATGLATAFRSSVTGYTRPTERWLEDQIPARIGDFTFIPSDDNPRQSYKMDADTYRILDPCGIVARTYTNGRERYDTVVIMGDHPDSMHDPEWCFTGQGWEIVDREPARVQLDGGKSVEIATLKLRRPDDAGSVTAAFVFQGPSGAYYHEHPQLWFDFMRAELLSGRPQLATFYRFIDESHGVGERQMLAFIGEYLARASSLREGR